MRYYTECPSNPSKNRRYVYRCDHSLYSECTLFKLDDRGLEIIQKRYNASLKIFWYGPIDTWLADEIFTNVNFQEYFDKHAKNCKDGLYPTVTVRRIMWALKMKPLKKTWWESHDKQPL